MDVYQQAAIICVGYVYMYFRNFFSIGDGAGYGNRLAAGKCLVLYRAAECNDRCYTVITTAIFFGAVNAGEHKQEKGDDFFHKLNLRRIADFVRC